MTPIQRYLIHCRKRLRRTAGAAYAAGKAAPRSTKERDLGKAASLRGSRTEKDTDPAPLRQPTRHRSPWGTHDLDGQPIKDPAAPPEEAAPLRETPKIVIQPQPRAYGPPGYRVYAWGKRHQYGDLLTPSATRMTALREAYFWAVSQYPREAVEVLIYEETPGPLVEPAERFRI